MTPTLRTLLLAAVIAVSIACDVVAAVIPVSEWVWVVTVTGQVPLMVFLLWLSHELDQWRVVAPRIVQAAERLEAAKPPLTQDDYAALLRTDEAHEGHFPSRPHRVCLRCSRVAAILIVRHPIWDGPFDGAGSGVVDERVLSWCLRCDGRPPNQAGRPVRLPYLDTEPIALLPELFGRDAFHRLTQRVIPAPVLPPRPTHAFEKSAGDWPICDVCGYAKDDPRHG
jgi:hypothetical protein